MSDGNLRVWHVILKSYKDLEDFYHDMETEGGTLYIPNRCVDCPDRMPESLVTKYLLTDEEAEMIRNDPRVEYVHLNPKDDNTVIQPLEVPPSQTSSKWDKSTFGLSSDMLNWGLVRCTQGRVTLSSTWQYPSIQGFSGDRTVFNNRPFGTSFLSITDLKIWTKGAQVNINDWSALSGRWDRTGDVSSSFGNPGNSWGQSPYGDSSPIQFRKAITATFSTGSTGKNVDVVICDGGALDPAHPEFQRNPDGTGGSRVVQYNWFQHNAELQIQGPSQFDYSLPTTGDPQFILDSHAMHVAGTAVGVTQGWAKEANIYWISFLNPDALRYIRAFHRNKPINPATGRRNPTVVNNSWGTFHPGVLFAEDRLDSWSRISSVTFRNQVYTKPSTSTFSKEQLTNVKLFPFTDMLHKRDPTVDTLYTELMREGVICVAAAGNSCYNIVGMDDDAFNSTVTVTGSAPAKSNPADRNFLPAGTYKYMQGISPGSSDRDDLRLNIGAMNNWPWETKADFSSTGKKVDLFAPGVAIMSSYLDVPAAPMPVQDSRSSDHWLAKSQGTSMATPQVTGIIACLAEQYPHWTNKEFKEYLLGTCEVNTLTDSRSSYNAQSELMLYYSLMDSPNRVVKFVRQRPAAGVTWPRQTHNLRGKYLTPGVEANYRGQYPRLKPARK